MENIKELIDLSKKYLEHQSIGNASKLKLAIEKVEKSLNSLPNGEASRVSKNEQCENVCLSRACGNNVHGKCQHGNYDCAGRQT